MNIDINEEIVRAAQNYARTHHAFNAGDRTAVTTTAHDLAAHSLAAALAERIIEADTKDFLEGFAEASRNMAAAEREEDARNRRRRFRR